MTTDTISMKMFTTENGIEHGLVETLGNHVKGTDFAKYPEKRRKELQANMKKDMRLVEVMYQNLKNQDNGKWEGSYCDYEGQPMYIFRFLHNHSYTLPAGLARKINALGVPIRAGLVNAQGETLKNDSAKVRTHLLVSIGEF